MALRNAATAAAPTPTADPTSPFEPDETAANDAAAPQTTVNDAPAAPTSPSATIPVPRASAVVNPLTQGSLLKSLKDVIGQSELEALGIGTFPRITVGLDGFSMDKTKELGKKIRFRVLSWNFLWLVTTGENTDNTEANKMIRTSYDGVNLKNGEGKVEDYVKKLRDVDGYDKTAVRQYAEVYANLLWTETKGDVPADEQGIVQISLSPQSVQKWQGYILDAAVRKARGLPETDEVTATQEKKMFGSNKFGVSIFSAR